MKGRIVSRLGIALLAAVCVSGERAASQSDAPARLGLGRLATPDEIKAWDISVMPDGHGLPPGSGTAVQGAATYSEKCASCHGKTGIEGPFERLVGREPRHGFPFGRDPALVKTIGNYWPYATTVFDYTNRAMPYNAPGSLSPSQVYGLVAFLLWRNEIIADTTVMDANTLPRVVMPARSRFVVDNRTGGPTVR